MGRRSRSTPADGAESWPDAAASDPVVEASRRFVVNLRAAIGDRSLRAVEAATGVNHTTIHAILAGQAWPDGVTIARLENGLGVALWPGPVAP